LNPSDQIYVLKIIATACEGSAGITGERHDLIVLIREASIEEAGKAALARLKRNLWEHPEIREIVPLNPKLGVPQVLEDAISDAAIRGFSLLVYKPISKH
jgi:hypothetical protein